jgi:hypothetical protein
MTICGALGLAATLRYPDGFSVTYRIVELVDPANAPIFESYQRHHGTPIWTEPISRTDRLRAIDIHGAKQIAA